MALRTKISISNPLDRALAQGKTEWMGRGEEGKRGGGAYPIPGPFCSAPPDERMPPARADAADADLTRVKAVVMKNAQQR